MLASFRKILRREQKGPCLCRKGMSSTGIYDLLYYVINSLVIYGKLGSNLFFFQRYHVNPYWTERVIKANPCNPTTDLKMFIFHFKNLAMLRISDGITKSKSYKKSYKKYDLLRKIVTKSRPVQIQNNLNERPFIYLYPYLTFF